MAAGLGFKTFTTGEVLTAADTNGYLMQGVLVFASAAARDAAITSPQEGQCCYLKDTDAVLTYSGAAWVGFDDSNAVQNSIVDAKGDLIAASAADTPARLAVGANDTMLVGDSTAATGLSYKSAATLYPWAAYTPTFSGITVGNGNYVARYAQIGKTVHVFFLLNWGSTTAVSNYGTFTLPVNSLYANYLNGVGTLADSGGNIYTSQGYMEGGNRCYFIANTASTSYVQFTPANGTGTPTTFGNADVWVINMTYEAA